MILKSKIISRIQRESIEDFEHFLWKQKTPIVIENAINDWPAMQWNFENLKEKIPSETIVQVDFFKWIELKKHEICWETNRIQLTVSFGEFIDWCNDTVDDTSLLFELNRKEYFGYLSYKYLNELLNECSAIDWTRFGGLASEKTALNSTIWIGTEKSSTPTHYDSYGSNIVAQLEGFKKWILFDPNDKENLYPTRIPFEESSIWSEVCIADPNFEKHALFKHCQPYETVLKKGDILYVPNQWWHFVETIENNSISVNLWIEHENDQNERLKESISRLLISLFSADDSRELKQLDLINPTDVCFSLDDNIAVVRECLQSVGHSGGFSAKTLINALLDDRTLRQIAHNLTKKQ